MTQITCTYLNSFEILQHEEPYLRGSIQQQELETRRSYIRLCVVALATIYITQQLL